MSHFWSNMVAVALIVAFLTGYVFGCFFSFFDLILASTLSRGLTASFHLLN